MAEEDKKTYIKLKKIIFPIMIIFLIFSAFLIIFNGARAEEWTIEKNRLDPYSRFLYISSAWSQCHLLGIPSENDCYNAMRPVPSNSIYSTTANSYFIWWTKKLPPNTDYCNFFNQQRRLCWVIHSIQEFHIEDLTTVAIIENSGTNKTCNTICGEQNKICAGISTTRTNKNRNMKFSSNYPFPGSDYLGDCGISMNKTRVYNLGKWVDIFNSTNCYCLNCEQGYKDKNNNPDDGCEALDCQKLCQNQCKSRSSGTCIANPRPFCIGSCSCECRLIPLFGCQHKVSFDCKDQSEVCYTNPQRTQGTCINPDLCSSFPGEWNSIDKSHSECNSPYSGCARDLNKNSFYDSSCFGNRVSMIRVNQDGIIIEGQTYRCGDSDDVCPEDFEDNGERVSCDFKDVDCEGYVQVDECSEHRWYNISNPHEEITDYKTQCNFTDYNCVTKTGSNEYFDSFCFENRTGFYVKEIEIGKVGGGGDSGGFFKKIFNFLTGGVIQLIKSK